MAHWLNKLFLTSLFLLFIGGNCWSQQESETPVYKDYQNANQFEKFRKRRLLVGAWQINQLKENGAIVVKLKTNSLLIEQLLKQGNTELALEKELEQFAINRNTLFAYLENLNFCKVYFMYSHFSDSLLNGARQGIFLDTNLTVDKSIVMTESFYLIAEKDFAYTSSIGFIREDSAASVKESGNPIKQMAIILKNKYGHQLKSPMPYAIPEKNFSTVNYYFPINYKLNEQGRPINIYFQMNRTYLRDIKTLPAQKIYIRHEGDYNQVAVKLKKDALYEKMSAAVSHLNAELFQTLKNYSKPDLNRVSPEIKLFLY